MNISREYVESVAGEVIAQIAGPEARPREDQIAAVSALLVDGRRTLVVQHTGWGKSAVYWIAANVVRRTGGGLVLVVSPLLALMRNQVESASRAGLKAVTLNSSNTEEWSEIERRILANEIDIVFVSPERLANPRFEQQVMSVLTGTLGLLVIDEAHCISSWGHDFRPDYQRMAALLMRNPDMPVLCTTATASQRVTTDIAAQLGDDTFVLRGQLARESLHLSVVKGLKPEEHYSWVSQALDTLTGSGIVYTLTVKKVQKLTEFLQSQGHKVAAYYGAVPTEERLEIEDALMRNELKAVVATSALGMGYDKPDLAFCIHVGCPGSPIDYYQQVGRAGRALDHAAVALVTDQAADQRIWEWFATSNVPKRDEADAVLRYLASADGDIKLTDVVPATGVTKVRAELLLKILAVDGAVERTMDGWRATGAPWTYDAVKYTHLIEARRADASRMADYASASQCLETQLRVALDDAVDPASRCGRCSACTGTLPYGLAATPSQAVTERAREFLRSNENVIEHRKQWPRGLAVPGLVISNTRMVPEYRCQDGRALAYGEDDPAWGAAVNSLAGNSPLPTDIKDGIKNLLERWKPDVDVVVPIPSSSRSHLVSELAEHVAGCLSIPIAQSIVSTPPPHGQNKTNAAHRPAQVARRLSVGNRSAVDGKKVLLVDDSSLTRWTLTISGALLRAAGAKSVTPFVLYQLASGDTTSADA